MTWAFKRQIFYVFTLIAFIFIFAFLIIYPKLNEAPTCMDGKQNGNETGVDCGGSCSRACIAQVDPISVIWSRAFKVASKRYNAMAYLENHNKNLAVNKVNYRFRFADENNVYIGKYEGSTFIPPSGNFAIFVPGIDVGNSIPVFTTFQFTEVPKWIIVEEQKIKQLRISVSDIALINEDANPKLSATVKNNSLFTIPEVGVVAILYDADHNAVSASQTYLEILNPEESKNISFTWPEPFSKKIIAKEMIPMYNIFSAKLK